MTFTAPRGRVATALVACALVALPAAAAPAGQPAAGPERAAASSPLRTEEEGEPPPVDVEDVAPAVLTGDDDLTLTVTVHAEEDLDEAAVSVAMNPAIPISRSVLAAWQSGTEPAGLPELVTEPVEDLEAGESRTLEVEVTAEELALAGAEWGPRGIEVLVRDGGEVLGTTRTVVVWDAPADSLEPLPVSLLVPATATSIDLPGLVPGLGPHGEQPDGSQADGAQPGTGVGGEDVDDAAGPPAEPPSAGSETPTDGDDDGTTSPDETALLDAAADPDGAAVAALAEAVAGTGATLVLDPLLLDGTADVGATELPTLADDDRLLALPSGDADLAALAHLGREDLARRLTEDAAARTSALSGTEVPVLAWPAAEEPDTDTLALAADVGTDLTLLPGEAVPAEDGLTYTTAGRAEIALPGAADIQVLLTEERASALLDSTLTAWGAGEESALTDLQARQMLLADLAVVFRERPSDPRPLVLSYDRFTDVDPDAVAELAEALAEAPWVDLVPPADLAAGPVDSLEPADLDRRVVEPGEVTAADLARAEETEQLAEAVATMTPTPPPLVHGAALAVRTSVAAGWREDPAGRTALVTGWSSRLTDATDAVRPTPTSPINLIASSADLPVRVTNDGEFDARVSVVVDPDDPRLRAPEPVELVVPAGGEATAQVAVSAIGSGDLPVEVRLESPQGRQIGASATIVVRVRAGWEGLGVSIAGGALALLVVVGLVRRIRRGVRVPTGDATPVIAGDPGAPTVHVTSEQPDVTDDGPAAPRGAAHRGGPPGTGTEEDPR